VTPWAAVQMAAAQAPAMIWIILERFGLEP